jgi:hypothetical protein
MGFQFSWLSKTQIIACFLGNNMENVSAKWLRLTAFSHHQIPKYIKYISQNSVTGRHQQQSFRWHVTARKSHHQRDKQSKFMSLSLHRKSYVINSESIQLKFLYFAGFCASISVENRNQFNQHFLPFSMYFLSDRWHNIGIKSNYY